MTSLQFFTAKEVRPEGWLRRQLELQANGLVGHLDQIWTAIRCSAWVGGEEDGWVIIAADDHAYTVLGYADHGHFNAAELPANAFEWLETYSAQIEQISEAGETPKQNLHATHTYTPVAPLTTTLW